jgi:hypothetical protein
MSSTNLRVLAAGLTLILAVLAGLVAAKTGGDTCSGSAVPAPATSAPSATPTAPGGAKASVTPQSNNDGGTAPSGQPSSARNGFGTGGGNNRSTDGTDGGAPGADSGVPLAAPAAGCDPDGFAVLPGLTAFIGVLLAGSLVGGLLTMAAHAGSGTSPVPGPTSYGPGGGWVGSSSAATASGPSATAPASGPSATAPTSGPSATAPSYRDRDLLIGSCVYVRDRVTSQALAERLGRTLSEVGVQVVAPVGQRFDPARHEAGGTAPTDDGRLDGTIAAVEVPGYVDHGTVLRAPVVTVYRRKL